MPIDPNDLRTGGALQGAVAASLLRQREAPAELAPGTRVGIYRIVRELGRGGMAIVYLAERDDGEYTQQVALKWMLQAQPDAASEALFRRERQALADLRHPHIARLLDGGRSEEGRPWFAMELIQGEPLDRHCVQAALPRARRLALFGQVCAAVSFAHARGVIHRDIKPSNVLVDSDGSARLLDFGIAQLLGQDDGLAHGACTPGFASPEQLRGERLTVASDVYQLGRLLAALLSADDRERQTTALAEAQRLTQLTTAPLGPGQGATPSPWPAGMPADLRLILQRATADAPESRYATADALAADVDAFRERRPVAARGRGLGYAARCWMRRHPLALALGAAALLLLVGGSAWFTARLARERDVAQAERRLAQTERERAEVQAGVAQSVLDFMRVDLLSSVEPARSRGKEPTVREALDAAAERAGTRFGDAPQELAMIRTTLAELYRELGLPEPSLREARAAVEAAERAPPAADTVRGFARLILATNLMHLRKLDEAEAVLPPDADGDAGLSREQLRIGLRTAVLRANLHAMRGRFDEAATLATDAMARARAGLGGDSTLYRSAALNAASFMRSAGRLEESQALQLQLYEEVREEHGDDHPMALGYAQRIAMTYHEMQRFDEALDWAERTLALRRRVQGETHPSTLDAAKVAATALQELRRHDEAEARFRAILAARRSASGAGHASTLTAMNDLGVLLSRAGKLEEAEALLAAKLDAQLRANPEPAPESVASRHNLAQVTMKLRRLPAAERMERAAIADATVLYGADAPQLASLRSGLAAIHEAQGRFAEADAEWEASLRILERKLGPEAGKTLRLRKARDDAVAARAARGAR
jgi:tetratricopeptide (TPR) repeat protein